jgi:hypothetical protein
VNLPLEGPSLAESACAAIISNPMRSAICLRNVTRPYSEEPNDLRRGDVSILREFIKRLARD